MNAGDIAFPHLGIYLENVPRSFTVFGFEIAFYGLIIGIGVLAGILMAVHQAKVSGENPDTIWDFAIYAVIFSVIGARIYYVIFAWDYYKDNLLSIFNTRNGGMAIYGGVIGAFLTLFLYCKIKKINPFRLGDLCVPGLILGQAIGRWGNFMNGEAYGWSPNVEAYPWRMVVNGTVAHPTFLYESLWNLVGFVIILLCYRKKRFDGEIISMYVLWYGFGRALIEFLRTDSLYVGNVKLMVVLGFAFFVCGVLGLVILGAKAKKGEAELEEYRRSHPAECAVDTGECSRCNDTGADTDSGSDTEPEDNDTPDDASASDDCETKEE